MKNSIFRKVADLFTKNLGLKLLAVAFSCGLWFVVNSITDPVESKTFYNVPVEIINDDLITSEGKVYAILNGTDSVNVTVEGKSSSFDGLTKEDIKAVADMSELTFMNTVGIKASSTRNNSEFEFKTNIDNLQLSIEDMKRVQMVINTSITGEPADGYVVGNVTPSLNTVRISGPESLINKVESVEAVTSISGASQDINTNVELRLYDAEDNEVRSSSINMNISTINVAVTILATKEVPLSFNTTGTAAEGFTANGEITCEPAAVLIAGRKSVLDTVSKISVTDPALDLTDRQESFTETVNIRKYLPSGTQFAESSFGGNVSVNVGIEKVVTRTLQIPASNLAVGNKPAGFNVTVRELPEDNPHPYTIKVTGTESVVNSIDENSVIGVVDMELLRESLGIDEWVPGTYLGDVVFNLNDVEFEEKYQFTITLQADEEENE